MARVKSIEGLRGVAMMMVFLSHFAVMFYPAHYWDDTISHLRGFDIAFGRSPFSMLISGNVGVCIFLTITGVGTYFVFQRGLESVKKYLILRFFKLMVVACMAAILMKMFIYVGLMDYYKEAENITGTPWLVLGGFNDSIWESFHKCLLHNPLVNLSKINGILWMIQYTFYGTFLAAIISFMFDDCSDPTRNSTRNMTLFRDVITYIVIICILKWCNIQDLYLCFVNGVFIAKLYKNGLVSSVKNHYINIGMAILGVYLCGYPTAMSPSIYYEFLPEKATLYHVFGTMILCFLVLGENAFGAIVNKKIFQILGKYSIAVYITHFCIVIGVSNLLCVKLSGLLEYNTMAIVDLLATIVVVGASSFVVQKIVNCCNKLMDAIYVNVKSRLEKSIFKNRDF